MQRTALLMPSLKRMSMGPRKKSDFFNRGRGIEVGGVPEEGDASSEQQQQQQQQQQHHHHHLPPLHPRHTDDPRPGSSSRSPHYSLILHPATLTHSIRPSTSHSFHAVGLHTSSTACLQSSGHFTSDQHPPPSPSAVHLGLRNPRHVLHLRELQPLRPHPIHPKDPHRLLQHQHPHPHLIGDPHYLPQQQQHHQLGLNPNPPHQQLQSSGILVDTPSYASYDVEDSGRFGMALGTSLAVAASSSTVFPSASSRDSTTTSSNYPTDYHHHTSTSGALPSSGSNPPAMGVYAGDATRESPGPPQTYTQQQQQPQPQERQQLSPAADYSSGDASPDSPPPLPPSSPAAEDDSRRKRKQRCRLCANHDIYAEVKGHKWYCRFREPHNCEKCEITRKRQYYMAEQQKLTREQQQEHLQQQQQQPGGGGAQSQQQQQHDPSNVATAMQNPTSCSSLPNVPPARPRRNFPRLGELVRETAHLNNTRLPGLFKAINDLVRNGSSSRSRSNQ